jgi:hypothetical protein
VVFAQLIVYVLAAYVGVGFVFACAFVIAGAGRIDPAAQGAPLGFKLLIIPGCIAFWPFLAKRWVGGATHPPTERNAHRIAARSRVVA